MCQEYCELRGLCAGLKRIGRYSSCDLPDSTEDCSVGPYMA
jgi:hypothetical protein